MSECSISAGAGTLAQRADFGDHDDPSPREISRSDGSIALSSDSSSVEERAAADTAAERLIDWAMSGEWQSLGAARPVLDLALAVLAESTSEIDRRRRMIEAISARSLTDELTGVYNRRGFMTEMRRALVLANRQGIGGAVVMIDLDGFKAINDRFGHGAGDAMLARVADMLRRTVREGDSVGRLGGDEFVILMPGMIEGESANRVSHLRRRTKALSVPWQGHMLSIGASFGYCDYVAGDDLEAILDRADRRMYEQKLAQRKAGLANGGVEPAGGTAS